MSMDRHEPAESLPLINATVHAEDEHEHWEHADEGALLHVAPSSEQIANVKRPAHSHKLGQILATAIAGNDITSSCFYTIGFCTVSAGIFAPISLMLVATVLFLFRSIYSEVGTALPLNGGAYNCLLNATSKFIASFAACLTILSYVATAVVSACSAMYYANQLWSELSIKWSTIGVLGFFALLTLMGLSESANVAVTMFFVHLTVMMLLVCFSLARALTDASIFRDNWSHIGDLNPAKAIFFGFAAALLGVSGFESSSNYIEEQKPGVFPKTLRNMWAITAILNPTVSILSLFLLRIDEIEANYDSLLAAMGTRAAGRWLNVVVSADATIVLSGAVLTAYVGVSGLIRRMAMDRCLPQFLLQTNPLRGTVHFIILGFFVVTSSLFLAVKGNTDTLNGVYTIAFLGVMSLFAIGNILLKYKRAKLPRTIYAPWPFVLIGLVGVMSGLIGNIVKNIDYVKYFSMYFVVTVTIVMIMFGRIRLLKVMLYFLKHSFLHKYFGRWIREQIRRIKKQQIVFFVKGDELSVLNKGLLYIIDNELTNWVRIVRVYRTEADIPAHLEQNVRILDNMYPKVRVDLVLIQAAQGFTPQLTDWIAEEFKVSKNFMFITCPGSRFPHNVSAFGGVRVITH